MGMKQALRQRLRAAPAVAAIVGTKVDWGQRPGLPCVTLNVVSGTIAQHMKGPMALQSARIQIDCWAATFVEAEALVEAVLPVVLPRAAVAGILFRSASATQPRDLGEQTDTDYIHRKQTDVTVRWSAVP